MSLPQPPHQQHSGQGAPVSAGDSQRGSPGIAQGQQSSSEEPVPSAFALGVMRATTDAILTGSQRQQPSKIPLASRASTVASALSASLAGNVPGRAAQLRLDTFSHSYLAARGGRPISSISNASAASSDTGSAASFSSSLGPNAGLPFSSGPGSPSGMQPNAVQQGAGQFGTLGLASAHAPAPVPAPAVPVTRAGATAGPGPGTEAEMQRKNARNGQVKHRWTEDETQALVDGCNKHGVGSWKIILSDPEFSHRFENRTAGDLKDRFRTYFPDAYHELYPNAKTHHGHKIRSKDSEGKSIFEKGKGKQKRPFTVEETKALHEGYLKFGSHWAKIGKDPIFQNQRSATDLRDRFRNAFREEYQQAGYKARTRANRQSSSNQGGAGPPEGSAPSTSSNASASGGEWSLSDATSDGNLTDHSSFSQDHLSESRQHQQRTSQVGPQRRQLSVRDARKSESGLSEASSSRKSSFSHSSRPKITSSVSGPVPTLPDFSRGGAAISAFGGTSMPLQVPFGTSAPPFEAMDEQHQLLQHIHAAPSASMCSRSGSGADRAMVDASGTGLRRSQSSKRAQPRISDQEFGRISPSMMLNTASGSAHPLAEDNFAASTGGGGFPWLSAMQMQIAMQLQAQMRGGSGVAHVNDREDEDEEYDSEGSDEDTSEHHLHEYNADSSGVLQTTMDALFSAPTVVQKAVEDMDAEHPLTSHIDASLAQYFATLPGLPDFANTLEDMNAEDYSAWQQQFTQYTAALQSGQQVGMAGYPSASYSSEQDASSGILPASEELGMRDFIPPDSNPRLAQAQGDAPAEGDWEAELGRMQQTLLDSGSLDPFGLPNASMQNNAAAQVQRRSTDTLRDQTGINQQPPSDLTAYLNTTASAGFDEQGFDPSTLAEWLGSQADLGPRAGGLPNTALEGAWPKEGPASNQPGSSRHSTEPSGDSAGSASAASCPAGPNS